MFDYFLMSYMWVIKFLTTNHKKSFFIEIKEFDKGITHWASARDSSLMRFCCNQQFMVKITSAQRTFLTKVTKVSLTHFYSEIFVLRQTAKWENWYGKKGATTNGFMLIRANNFTSWGVNETSDDKNLFHVSQ